eukprot:5115534-Amphidinium_carterae.1
MPAQELEEAIEIFIEYKVTLLEHLCVALIHRRAEAMVKEGELKPLLRVMDLFAPEAAFNLREPCLSNLSCPFTQKMNTFNVLIFDRIVVDLLNQASDGVA